MRARRRHRRKPAQAGFSLLELMLTTVVVLVAGLAIVQGVVISGAATVRSDLRVAAIEAARGWADRVASTPIGEVWERWRPGGTEGDRFSVPTPEGRRLAGRIRIVCDETQTDADVGMALGMPRDLDGDGAATHTDVSTTARVLPVIVEVEWSLLPGDRETYRLPVVVVRGEE